MAEEGAAALVRPVRPKRALKRQKRSKERWIRSQRRSALSAGCIGNSRRDPRSRRRESPETLGPRAKTQTGSPSGILVSHGMPACFLLDAVRISPKSPPAASSASTISGPSFPERGPSYDCATISRMVRSLHPGRARSILSSTETGQLRSSKLATPPTSENSPVLRPESGGFTAWSKLVCKTARLTGMFSGDVPSLWL
jgi:hypothetical protein